MKKLTTSCVVVVILATLAYQADATIVTLTKDAEPPGTLKTIEFIRLTDYDLTAENDITLSNLLAASFGRLTSDGSDLAGYNPIIDIKVALVDGSYHEVDSTDLAFRVAAGIAFSKGVRKAGPALLEPIMSLEVVVPSEYMGDVITDLHMRRG